MTRNHDFNQLDPSRQKQHDLLSLLARVVICGHEFSGDETEEDLRQLGYGADLARGRVRDPDQNLDALAIKCRNRLSGLSPANRNYRDPVQALWGAEWNMDLGKIRSELHVYIQEQKFSDTPFPN